MRISALVSSAKNPPRNWTLGPRFASDTLVRHISPFDADGSVNVIVESPKGASIKLKYDDSKGVMVLSRPLQAGLTYPFDWGFIPGTRGADGDPLDAMVLWDSASYPGVLIPSRLIGMLCVEQTNLRSGKRERNDRLLAVPTSAARIEIRTVDDLTARAREELESFFHAAVAFQQKNLKILSWAGPDEAMALLRASMVPLWTRALHAIR
jgi:inorganic pyrophosphatase